MMSRNVIILTFILLINQVLSEADEEPFQCHELYEYDASIKGEVLSPFYGETNYPDKLWCEYRIRAPEGHKIKITFIDLDIQASGSCSDDKLVVFSKEKESTLATFCGQFLPNPIVSKDNEIRLLLLSDFISGGRGFRLRYESGPDIELCSRNEHECKNRNCYTSDKICNGVDDCGDGTDEEKCGKPVIGITDECGKTPIKPISIHGSPDRQVGGIEAIPNSWPWQVSLQRSNVDPNGHFCGGSLVSPQWVVTAAHCVKDTWDPSEMKIILGAHNKFAKTKYQITRMVERIISYPDLEFDKVKFYNIRDDMALIKLNAPVTFSDGIQPVCLPQLGWDLETGQLCYATGWGDTRGSGFTDELKQTEQIVQNNSHCGYNLKTQICVSNTQKGPCHGDSGGPLVCKYGDKWYLMGATSFGVPTNMLSGLCGLTGSKTIFSKVSDKTDWIQQLINNYS